MTKRTILKRPVAASSDGYDVRINIEIWGTRRFGYVNFEFKKGDKRRIMHELAEHVKQLAIKHKIQIVVWPEAWKSQLRKVVLKQFGYELHTIVIGQHQEMTMYMHESRDIEHLYYVPVANDWNEGLITCPFCEKEMTVQWKGFHGGGKKCECGAMLSHDKKATKWLWLL